MSALRAAQKQYDFDGEAPPDDGIDVQALVDQLTRDDLRDLRAVYRWHWTWKAYGKPPCGMRFGAWVRDQLWTRAMGNRP